jgi:2-polyprenyl-6-methoxyphenol hydroxylase-like FAD-dependent oxidoreductase
MSQPKRRVLIVGGGIGGLSAAIALGRQHLECEIVEVDSTWTVYGVGIIQPNNVLRALDRIGLAQACVDRGGGFPGWRIFDAHGQFLMDAPNTNRAAPLYPPINGITRPILQSILAASARSLGCRIRLGVTVRQIDDTGQAVYADFTDGTQGTYDLIIGADGAYSKLRHQLFGQDLKPQFTGQGAWRYNLKRPASVEWGELYFGRTSKVGLVPLSADLMYLFAVTEEPGNPKLPPNQLARILRERIAEYTGPVAALREQIADPAAVVYKPMESMLLPTPWFKGRTLLIGDAAHATTPHLAQGAAMAIEDAVLIGELLGTDAALPVLFEEFMARRYRRCQYVVETSRQIGDWEMESWRGIPNPNADPGGLLHRAQLALLDEY